MGIMNMMYNTFPIWMCAGVLFVNHIMPMTTVSRVFRVVFLAM